MFRVALYRSRSIDILPIHSLRVTVNFKPYRSMASSNNMRDPNTLANYDCYRTTHTVTNFDIDFDKRCLSGNVILSLKCQNLVEKPDILLDTSHLDIGGVKLDGEKAEYELLTRVEPYGSALRIKVKPDHAKEEIGLDVSCEPSFTSHEAIVVPFSISPTVNKAGLAIQSHEIRIGTCIQSGISILLLV